MKENCLQDLSFLVVDDVPDNCLLMRMILKTNGAKVALAVDGQEAQQRISEDDYDIILMDLHMPVMDGIEATKMLRSGGFTKPIIAVTATDVDELRIVEKMNLFDRIIRKPVDRVQFLEEICGFISAQSAPQSTAN